MKKVVLITATFNEIENIEELITQVQNVFKSLQNYECHHLVVDGSSPDGTGAKVEELKNKYQNLHLLSVEKKGVGADVRRGIAWAQQNLNADIFIHLDADLSHNPKDIPKLLEKIEWGADLVIGSRNIEGGKNELPPFRWLLSWGGNFVMKFFMGARGITEFTNSCRAYTKELLNRMDKNDFAFDGNTFYPAFTYTAYQIGAKIVEIPIVFTTRQKGESKIEVLTYSPTLFKYAFKAFIQRLIKSKK